MAMNTSVVMAGRMSRELKQKLELYKGDIDHSVALRWYSHLFTPPGGAHVLWELVSVLNGQDDSLLPDDYSRGIMHAKHLVKFKASEAQELEMVKMARHSSAGKGREEKLREAASIHIRLGQVQRYCELMVDVHEWEKALSVAPAVSMEYWRTLSERYADYLASENSNDCVPYYVATGNIQRLLDYFSGHNQLPDALLVAQVACENGLATGADQPHPGAPGGQNGLHGLHEPSTENVGRLNAISGQLADRYFQDGQPVLAACCHLAVGDTRCALSKLIRGHELELAISIGRVLEGSKHSDLIAMATRYLTRRCQRLGKWELALDLSDTIADSEDLKKTVCIMCASSSTEVNFLHQKAGLVSVNEYLLKAKELEAKGDTECIKHYLLSSTAERALVLGIPKITDKMCERNWTLQDVLPMINLLQRIRNDVLVHKTEAKERTELMILSFYLGSLRAIRRGYRPIVLSLLKYTRQMLLSNDLNADVSVPLSEEQLKNELDAWTAYQEYQDRLMTTPDTSLPSKTHTATYKALLQRAGSESSELENGVDLVTGSRLPCHSDVHVSLLTGARIQGPVFFLEDGKSVIALNDALMWAKVNPFSPLCTGAPINPF